MKPLVLEVICILVAFYIAVSNQFVFNRSLIFPLPSPSQGKPFDDGAYAIVPPVTGIQSLLIRHGNYIDGIQATYILEDGQTVKAAYHGGEGGNVTEIQIHSGETIARVEGYSEFPLGGYLTELTFYTRDSSGDVHQYGPIGNGDHLLDSLFSFSGIVIGLFGQSDFYLNGIGFQYDTSPTSVLQPFYKKSRLVGGKGGIPFDDAVSTLNPLQIKHIAICYGKYINGISTTYLLRNGSVVIKTYGTVQTNTSSNNSLININLADDERIVVISLTNSGESANYVSSIKLYTYRPNEYGIAKDYGPYGTRKKIPGPNNSDSVIGVISGFYGRSGTMMDAIGVYT